MRPIHVDHKCTLKYFPCLSQPCTSHDIKFDLRPFFPRDKCKVPSLNQLIQHILKCHLNSTKIYIFTVSADFKMVAHIRSLVFPIYILIWNCFLNLYTKIVIWWKINPRRPKNNLPNISTQARPFGKGGRGWKNSIWNCFSNLKAKIANWWKFQQPSYKNTWVSFVHLWRRPIGRCGLPWAKTAAASKWPLRTTWALLFWCTWPAAADWTTS